MTDPAPERPAAASGFEPTPPLADEPVPAVPPQHAASPGAHAIEADAGRTYDSVLEPSSAKRLPLGEGEWHQISRSYKWARLISLGAILVAVVVAAIVGAMLLQALWPLAVGAALFVWYGWSAVITPRQARAYAYQLRDDDLVFRRGILWQRQVAVPYGRMQLVDITHGPLDRAFGIAQLKLVTAAASTGVTIPGLTQASAEQLRDTLVEVAESRRTGL